jgi:hypothetical protein
LKINKIEHSCQHIHENKRVKQGDISRWSQTLYGFGAGVIWNEIAFGNARHSRAGGNPLPVLLGMRRKTTVTACAGMTAL